MRHAWLLVFWLVSWNVTEHRPIPVTKEMKKEFDTLAEAKEFIARSGCGVRASLFIISCDGNFRLEEIHE